MDADAIIDFETDCSKKQPGKWYKLDVSGEKPTPRVGHTATTLPHRGEVILIGGASPDDLYDEAWRLDLNRLECSRIELVSDREFTPRYEHCALLVPRRGGSINAADTDAEADAEAEAQNLESDRIWVFAGANMLGNLSDLWELELDPVRSEPASWHKVSCSGSIPSARTLHTSTALVGKCLTLFGGGLQAATPVDDTTVYQLDPTTVTWATRQCSGSPPPPRQGHILASLQDKLIIHGGMASNTFFSDLYVLSQDGRWQVVPDAEPNPGKRAGHGCVVYKKWVYIWGGLGPHGTLSDCWRLDTESLVWEEISATGEAPKPRLDFAICVIHLPDHFSKPSTSSERNASSVDQHQDSNGHANGVDHEEEHDNAFILLHGGMDDQGNIFDDFYVFRIEP